MIVVVPYRKAAAYRGPGLIEFIWRKKAKGKEKQNDRQNASCAGQRYTTLKNIDVDIPLNKIVGIAGVSGRATSLALGCCMPKAPAGIWRRCPPTPAAG